MASVLAGKVALISGGTSGIGAATARIFAEEGATVIVTGSNPDTLQKARNELTGIEVVTCDAADLSAIEALISGIASKYGRLDVLFVNAGIVQYLPITDIDAAIFDKLFNVNTRGAFFLIKESVRIMPDGGAIVLTSSISHGMGMPHLSVYAASKAAVRSLGRSLAAELAPRNIRVNTISPGPIATPIWTKSNEASDHQLAEIQAEVATSIPLKRFGQPEEIASAALFLASAASSFTTGADLPVDGGVMDLGYAR